MEANGIVTNVIPGIGMMGGDVINYTKWNSREPNNLGDREDCIEVRTDSAGWTPNRHWLNGTWNDRPCNDTSNHNGFVCKTK